MLQEPSTTVLSLWLVGRGNGWQLDQFCKALQDETGVEMAEVLLQERFVAYCKHPFGADDMARLAVAFATPPRERRPSLLLRIPSQMEPQPEDEEQTPGASGQSPLSLHDYSAMEGNGSPAGRDEDAERRGPYLHLVVFFMAICVAGFLLTLFQSSVYASELPRAMRAMFPFCFLTSFLLLGMAVRANSLLCRKCFFPSSVIGGVLACAVLNGTRAAFESHNPEGVAAVENLTEEWYEIPGVTINIVFATLFIGQHIPTLPVIWQTCSLQLAYGQILAWGEYALGLSVGTLFGGYLMEPKERLFGVILPVGFEGGHGTAAGMDQLFETVGWSEGVHYCAASATIGMVSGLLVGILLVNWYRRFKVPAKPPPVDLVHATRAAQEMHEMTEAVSSGVPLGAEDADGPSGFDMSSDPHASFIDPFAGLREQDRLRRENKELMRLTFHPASSRPEAGREVVSGVAVDNLAYHIALVMLAVCFGYSMKMVLMTLDATISPELNESDAGVFRTVPTFPICMLGGILMQITLDRSGESSKVDKKTLSHITSAALDYLVVSSIATIRIGTIAEGILPFAILMLVGVLWQVFMCLVVAPRVFLDNWFERGIVELGQSTGVSATGLLLLRFVDPTATNPAFIAFAFKQILHEPFMGGGIWTTASVPLTHAIGPFPVMGISIGAMVAWSLLIAFYLRPNQKPASEAAGILGMRKDVKF